MKGLHTLAATALLFPLFTTSAFAAETIVKLGASGPDTGINQQFGPSDINSRGEIVGTLLQRDGRIRAYRYRGGKRNLLPTPDEQNSEATSINNFGMISGSLTNTTTGQSRPSGWNAKNESIAITIPSQFAGRATKVNDYQLFIGELATIDSNCFLNPATCDTRGFQFGTGIYLPLPTRIESVNDLTTAGLMIGSTSRGGIERAMALLPGEDPFELPGLGNANYSVATAVNAAGQIVGNVASADSQLQPFLWDNGEARVLGTLSTGYAIANDINENKVVVGDSELTPSGTHQAFIWTESAGIRNLNSFLPTYSPWVLETAKAINKRGEIVGRGTKYGVQSDYVLRLVFSKMTPDSQTKAKLRNTRGVLKRSPLRFKAALKNSAEEPITQAQLHLERSLDGGIIWRVIDTLETDEDGQTEFTIRPTRSARFRVIGPIDNGLLPAFDSDPISVKVRR